MRQYEVVVLRSPLHHAPMTRDELRLLRLTEIARQIAQLEEALRDKRRELDALGGAPA
jgi:hypothetical protein